MIIAVEDGKPRKGGLNKLFHGRLERQRKAYPKCRKIMDKIKKAACKDKLGGEGKFGTYADWGLPTTRGAVNAYAKPVEFMEEVPEEARAFTCTKCDKHLPWIAIGQRCEGKKYNTTERLSIKVHGKKCCPWRGNLITWQRKKDKEEAKKEGKWLWTEVKEKAT